MKSDLDFQVRFSPTIRMRKPNGNIMTNEEEVLIQKSEIELELNLMRWWRDYGKSGFIRWVIKDAKRRES